MEDLYVDKLLDNGVDINHIKYYLDRTWTLVWTWDNAMEGDHRSAIVTPTKHSVKLSLMSPII